jgi:cell division protein FtsL
MGALYLNHVFATEQLLREVQQLEQEYNQVKRVHNDYKLTYEQMIGPAKIYEVAKEQGFVNGGPAEKVIEVEK